MNRREFLMGSAMTVAAAGRGRAQTPDRAKLDRVGIMTYSFDRIMKIAGRPDDPARTLEILETPAMFADRYHVHNVEVQHSHFASTESSYFKEFRSRLAKSKSRISNINLEFGNMNISSAEPVLRVQAIDLTKRWIDHAVELECPRVMVNQGTPTPENKLTAIATLKTMGEYGRSKKVMVAMENRGGGGGRGASGAPAGQPPQPQSPAPPAPAVWILLAEIIKTSGTYANCDIGNFPDQETQHNGMRALFPMTDGNCHVKMNPARFDLPAALALTKELGYKGLYSIEAGGAGDPYEAVQNIYDVLLANI